MFWDKEIKTYLLHRLKVLHYSVQCPEREKSAQQNGHKIHFCKEDRKCFCPKKKKTQIIIRKKKKAVPLVQFSHLVKQSEADISPLPKPPISKPALCLMAAVSDREQGTVRWPCGTPCQPCMPRDSSGTFLGSLTKTGQSNSPALGLL